MEYKAILVFLIILSVNFVFSQSSSSTSYEIDTGYIYSVTNQQSESQIALVFNPWSNGQSSDIISNSTISIPYLVNDILYLDQTTNSIILLCTSNQNTFILVSLSEDLSKFSEITSFTNDIITSYTMETQSFIFVDKVAYMPILDLSGGSTSSEETVQSMGLNFNSGNVDLVEIYTPGFTSEGRLPIQGFDYINNVMYIAYQTNDSQTNLVSYNLTNPSVQTIYPSISNVSYAGFMFTDSNGELYILGPTNITNYDGWCQICRVDLSSSGCEQVFAAYLGVYDYKFQPYFLTQDKSKLIFLTLNQDNQLKFEIVYINHGFDSEHMVIDNEWLDSHDMWSYFAF